MGAIAALTLLTAASASAFCGFYVAKADTKLFNKASQVVLVRDGDRTVLTMSNDYQGDLKEFAIVLPSPTVLERGQINVTERALIDHLDAYTSPRLVEYFDYDPCSIGHAYKSSNGVVLEAQLDFDSEDRRERAKALGVTIEAEYTVGEYDIIILSAKQSDGLETWLKQENYNIPEGASDVLGSYIKQDMKFFVAKVNLEEQAKTGYSYLRPIQIAYESPKFMLPIRLGTVNANGPQELFVYALTRTGRVETTNYRTVKLESNVDIPVFVKDEFGSFYRDMFTQHVNRESMRTVFLEYAWDMSWCDPCAANGFTADELRELGVMWDVGGSTGGAKSAARNVYVTRLHVRYDKENFPEDLFFQATGNRQNFQGRYVVRHPWDGDIESCEQAKSYYKMLAERQEREAQTLASLTGWDINEIRAKMEITAPPKKQNWWDKLWGKNG